MICIPFIINDNYKIARMGAQQDAPPFFIIDTTSDVVELFHFEERFFAFDPDRGMGENGEKDYNFEVLADKCTVINDSANHIAEVDIAIRKTSFNGGNTSHGCQFDVNGLYIDGNKVSFNMSNIGHNSNCVSTVKVRFFDVDVNGMEYIFGLNVTKTQNIYDIVIDFGSEASQVWIYQRILDSENLGNHMPLFDNIKNADSTLTSIEDKKIYQYDADNSNLFRSLFFIKKTVTGNSINQSDLTFINNEDDLIKILQDSVALPNLKLMDHNQVYLPNFSFNGTTTNIFLKSPEIRAEILKFFFQTVLKHVNNLAGDRDVACKLTFLVPNTYKQDTLSMVYNQLIKDIDELFTTATPASSQTEQRYSHIKRGVEVATFSESDASFFGSYNSRDYDTSQSEQLILIIDIGKGTTDFSILCVKGSVGRSEVERYARSGFVGAGNVMTFAILVSVVQQLADQLESSTKADIYDTIYGLAYNADYAKKTQLYHLLEELKRNSPMEGRISLTQFISKCKTGNLKGGIKSVAIERWIDILHEACNEKCYIDADDSVVQTYAELMAKRLVSEVKYVFDESKKINKVIFSGRGAKSKVLEDAIIKELSELVIEHDSPDDVFEILPDTVIKTGCLKGPLNGSLRLDHMNMPIVGWPIQVNFQQLDRKSRNPKGKRNKCFLGRIWGFINEDNNALPEPSLDEEEEMIRELRRTRKVPMSSSSVMSKIQGLPVNITADGNRFVLGNRRCFVNLDESQQGEKRIFFDGERFVARDEKRSYKFVYDPNPIDESFITETLFPMTGENARIDMQGVNAVLDSVLQSKNDDDDWQEEQYDAEGNGGETVNKAVVNHVDADDDDFSA